MVCSPSASFSSLDACWKPLHKINFNNQIRSTNIPLVKHERLEYENRPLCDTTAYLKLSAFPNVLHHDAYKIVIYACENQQIPLKQSVASRVRDLVRLGSSVQEMTPRAALLSYILSTPTLPSGQCTCLLTSVVEAAPALSSPRLSYAGYFLDAGERKERSDPAAGTAVVDARRRAGWLGPHTRKVLNRGHGWRCMRLASSGTVIYLEGSSVVVSYYA
ncbi:hypothetical protein MVEN_02325600 [Mycena venus]|uniref:Uncharacterized protein n=1 Tax=Mycena venus TaxID=2733690 RepID=A0A8H6X460_9AGAR|nr:hypothetical protein MVEN_02325600 [Mycena venus]